MRMLRPATVAAAAAVAASWAGPGVAPAAADAPPPAWGAGDRVLTCGSETLAAQWSRGGPLTVLLVRGSTDVIVPKIVEVTEGGVTSTTLQVPGFRREDLQRCDYTDPDGRLVRVWGLRT